MTLAAHHAEALEIWTRADDGGWSLRVAHPGEVAELTAIDARLDVRELYEAAAEPS